MKSVLDLIPGQRVAVIGDVMLDCYVSGEVQRISPEAPVPIMRVTNERSTAGGAANVAANLAALGVDVSLVGLVGQDDAGVELVARLQALGSIDTGSLVADGSRRTTRKLRIIGAHQQIVRVDHEDRAFPIDAIEKQIIERAMEAIERCSVVVLSDYGKGLCSDHLISEVLARAQALARPAIVDPKRLDLRVYRGATILTPNRKELSEATRMPCETDDEAAIAAARAQADCGADILLTRSEKGMSLFPMRGNATHLGTVARDVFDVSGAGDTVVAVLAASMAAGAPMPESMRLANHAAGIVVSKLGTASVTRSELYAVLMDDHDAPNIPDGGLIDRRQLIKLREQWEREKLTVGIANGCFDLVHPGHVSLIRQAAASCDRLVVALNSDASVRRLKGRLRPVQDERSRAVVIGALKGVVAVVIFDEDTPETLIRSVQPDILVKGADYNIDDVVGADIVKARGGRIILADLVEGQSATRLIERSRAPAE